MKDYVPPPLSYYKRKILDQQIDQIGERSSKRLKCIDAIAPYVYTVQKLVVTYKKVKYQDTIFDTKPIKKVSVEVEESTEEVDNDTSAYNRHAFMSQVKDYTKNIRIEYKNLKQRKKLRRKKKLTGMLIASCIKHTEITKDNLDDYLIKITIYFLLFFC